MCFKNWNFPSTAMEADIIVDGFKRSLDMHNLIYSRLIGDGDSSFMNKLHLAKPYGSDFVIKKIECSNHILRNYVNKLKDIATKRRTNRGVNIPGNIRQTIKDRILRLRYAITEAVKYWKNKKDISFEEKLLSLKKDLMNGHSHVFGEHTNCSVYFCKGTKDGELNLVPEMKSLRIWDELVADKSHILFHAKSLLYKVNNNAAESYNSILAKFIGGKRVNFSMRGSYSLRCNAAVTSYNEGPRRLYSLHKRITKRSPGIFTKKYISKSILKSESRSKRRLFHPPVYNKTVHGPDEHYGATTDLTTSPDMSKEEFEIKKDIFLSRLKLTGEQIEQIEKDTRRQNECTEWHLHRKKRLTASYFGKVCKLRVTTSRAKTVSNILYGSFSGNNATKYGTQNEENAKSALSGILNKTIVPSGLIIDKDLPFLAASPDGLIDGDSLVEIKCPITSKELTTEEGISRKKITSCEIVNGKLRLKRTDTFYYQVQGQLHISKRTFCYFCIWTPRGMLHEKIKRDDDFWSEKMLHQLTNFYYHCLLPEIVDSRFDRNLPIRDGLASENEESS